MPKSVPSFQHKGFPHSFPEGTNISQETNDGHHALAKKFKEENTPESLELLDLLIEAGHSPEAVVIANVSPEQEEINKYEKEHIKELQEVEEIVEKKFQIVEEKT